MPRLPESTRRCGTSVRLRLRRRAALGGERRQIRVEARRAPCAGTQPSRLACTCAAVTPGFTRPMTCSHQYVGRASSGNVGSPGGVGKLESCGIERERHGDVRPSRTACCTSTNSGEMTPTIVTGTLLNCTTLPTARGSPAEPRAPVPRADDGDRSGGRLVVLRHDDASGVRGQAEHAVVVARRDERVRDVGLAVDDDVGAAVRRAREEIVHRPVVRDELLEHRVGEGAADGLAAGVLRENP